MWYTGVTSPEKSSLPPPPSTAVCPLCLVHVGLCSTQQDSWRPRSSFQPGSFPVGGIPPSVLWPGEPEHQRRAEVQGRDGLIFWQLQILMSKEPVLLPLDAGLCCCPFCSRSPFSSQSSPIPSLISKLWLLFIFLASAAVISRPSTGNDWLCLQEKPHSASLLENLPNKEAVRRCSRASGQTGESPVEVFKNRLDKHQPTPPGLPRWRRLAQMTSPSILPLPQPAGEAWQPAARGWAACWVEEEQGHGGEKGFLLGKRWVSAAGKTHRVSILPRGSGEGARGRPTLTRSAWLNQLWSRASPEVPGQKGIWGEVLHRKNCRSMLHV